MNSFAFAHAAGTEWKSVTEKCLVDLGTLEKRSGFEHLGMVYMTDNLAGDAENILARLREETGITNWIGSVGMGICATGHEYFDQPALALLIAELPQDGFRLLELQDSPKALPLLPVGRKRGSAGLRLFMPTRATAKFRTSSRR